MNRNPGLQRMTPCCSLQSLQFQSTGKVKFLQDCRNCKLQMTVFICRNP